MPLPDAVLYANLGMLPASSVAALQRRGVSVAPRPHHQVVIPAAHALRLLRAPQRVPAGALKALLRWSATRDAILRDYAIERGVPALEVGGTWLHIDDVDARIDELLSVAA